MTFFRTRPPERIFFSRAVDGVDAHDVVAHGAPGDAAGAGEVGSHDAGDGLRLDAAEEGCEIRGFGDEVLAAGGEGGFEFGERGAGAGGDDEFAGGVEGDAGEILRRQGAGGLDGTEEAGLAVAAGDGKGFVGVVGLADGFDDALLGGGGHAG